MMHLALSPSSLFLFPFGRSTPCSLVWWLLCLQWSVYPPLARQSGCQSCTPKVSSCLCLISIYDCHSHSSSESRAEGRYEKEYFCVEKCVSLWPVAREAARQTATQQSPVPTHMATIHHCPPPTSTSLLPSILSFLICSSHPRRSLSARSHSSRPATSTGALLIVVSHERGNDRRHGSQLDSPHPADGLHIVTHRRRV
jgi:hypothetical protein